MNPTLSIPPERGHGAAACAPRLLARLTGLALFAAFAAPSVAGQSPAADAKPLAPLLDGMGAHHRAIDTDDPLAQRYFDQGLVLAYGFNHAEAERSFREAARREPGCAICWWGAALVLGPNVNAKMEDAAVPRAWEALGNALSLADLASEPERALIEALAKRYAAEPAADRSALDQAYADAMREVVRRFPDDLDAATLFAEAAMDLHPWDYWTKDRQPHPWTPEILAALEGVLARDPRHPGANHLYVHAVEASAAPGRAEAAADRLRDLVPGAGHLVHMPAHIYLRVGRYADAVTANERAIAADRGYLTQCHAQGIYPVAYVPHNHHFLWFAAALQGRGALAMDAARHMAAHQDPAAMREPGNGTLQHYFSIVYYSLARFGRWDEALAEPAPPADLLYPRAIWHYARAMARLRKGHPQEARAELAELVRLAGDPAVAEVTLWDINPVSDLLAIAAEVVRGELAAADGDREAAVAHLEKALAIERALTYDEPPPWHQPVAQILGGVLLEAGRPADAERAFREDLELYPENGWSLSGLRAALAAQGKAAEAAEVSARFHGAWAQADFALVGSRL